MAFKIPHPTLALGISRSFPYNIDQVLASCSRISRSNPEFPQAQSGGGVVWSTRGKRKEGVETHLSILFSVAADTGQLSQLHPSYGSQPSPSTTVCSCEHWTSNTVCAPCSALDVLRYPLYPIEVATPPTKFKQIKHPHTNSFDIYLSFLNESKAFCSPLNYGADPFSLHQSFWDLDN